MSSGGRSIRDNLREWRLDHGHVMPDTCNDLLGGRPTRLAQPLSHHRIVERLEMPGFAGIFFHLPYPNA